MAIALIALGCALTFIIATSYSLNIYNGLVADVQQRAEMYTKLEQIDTYVRAYYDGTIDEDALIEALAKGYIGVLNDSQAKYMNADEYELYKERLSGIHTGIGVYCTEVGGYLYITEVIDNSPAATAGIKVGESIVAIGGTDVWELGYQKAYDLIRSDSGTTLSITVRNSGIDRKLSVTTTQMTMGSVSTKMYGDYGYIKIKNFGDKTYQQFTAAYSMLTTSEVKGIVVDLRNNSGSSYDSVINILNSYLPVDSVISITQEISGEETISARATGNNVISVPIVVLINSNTSGPAELFAAALKDHLMAQVVGTTTAGNGTYPEIYSLYDGACIVLPVATVRSATIAFDGSGIKPDYEVVMSDTDEETLKTYDETTDLCIKRALELLTQKG